MIKKNGKYFKFINGVTYDLTTNLPMMNISYYEAQAYCRWKGVRLPTETEFEYVSTNGGNTFILGEIQKYVAKNVILITEIL